VFKSGVIGTRKYVACQAKLVYSTKALQERRINEDDFARFEPDRSPNWIMDDLGVWSMGWAAQTFCVFQKSWPKDGL
jgi:hypothetical protein